MNQQTESNMTNNVVDSYSGQQPQNQTMQAGPAQGQQASSGRQTTVIGVFSSQSEAETAVRTLRTQGFNNEEINIVSKEQDKKEGGNGQGQMYDDDITDGALAGGTIGGIGGLLVGAGALMVPGIGPLLAAGPISAVIGGALAGGLTGGLIDWGIPSEASEHYAQQVEDNKILAMIRTGQDKVDKAALVLRQHGAQDVESHAVNQ